MRRLHYACLVMLVGCGLLQQGAPSSVAPPPGTSPGWGRPTMVTSDDSLGSTCEVIAVLSVPTTARDRGSAFEELGRQAAALGGQAVVSARFDPDPAGTGGWISGVIVRAKDTDARPYDAIARVDAQTDAGADGSGLEALRERGRQLGADKLVDVRFEQRGADGRAHLSALAVRYRRSAGRV